MASEAKTARAMILISRWCCSSVEAIGGPIKIRFIVEYMAALTLSCGGCATVTGKRRGRAFSTSRTVAMTPEEASGFSHL